eukprot:g22790.t2
MVIPVSDDAFEYATYVKETLHARGFHVEANLGDGTLNKKVREAQVAQFNYILVVGKDEEEQLAVNVRVRGQKRPLGTKGLQEFLEELEEPKTARLLLKQVKAVRLHKLVVPSTIPAQMATIAAGLVIPMGPGMLAQGVVPDVLREKYAKLWTIP